MSRMTLRRWWAGMFAAAASVGDNGGARMEAERRVLLSWPSGPFSSVGEAGLRSMRL